MLGLTIKLSTLKKGKQMRYSVEFNDGSGWTVAQSNIGNRTTAEQILAVLSADYPDYQFRIVANELVVL